MSHDHARLSALVDGELDHEARDRLLAHLAHCDECRAAVDTERRVKALLSGMPEPRPSTSLHANLLRVAESGGAPAQLSVTRGRNAPVRGVPAPLASGPPGQPGSRRPRRATSLVAPGRQRRLHRRVGVGVAGVAAIAGVAFGAAFMAGGDAPTTEVTVVPPVRQYSIEHAETVSNLPLSDPGAVSASFERSLLELPAGR